MYINYRHKFGDILKNPIHPFLFTNIVIVPHESHKFLKEIPSHPTKAKNCWRKCLRTLQKHKHVGRNASAPYKSINLLRKTLLEGTEVQNCWCGLYLYHQKNLQLSDMCLYSLNYQHIYRDLRPR